MTSFMNAPNCESCNLFAVVFLPILPQYSFKLNWQVNPEAAVYIFDFSHQCHLHFLLFLVDKLPIFQYLTFLYFIAAFWLHYRGLRSRMPFPWNWIFPEKFGKFPVRAFENILFPVPAQYRYSGLAVSQSR